MSAAPFFMSIVIGVCMLAAMASGGRIPSAISVVVAMITLAFGIYAATGMLAVTDAKHRHDNDREPQIARMR